MLLPHQLKVELFESGILYNYLWDTLKSIIFSLHGVSKYDTNNACINISVTVCSVWQITDPRFICSHHTNYVLQKCNAHIKMILL